AATAGPTSPTPAAALRALPQPRERRDLDPHARGVRGGMVHLRRDGKASRSPGGIVAGRCATFRYPSSDLRRVHAPTPRRAHRLDLPLHRVLIPEARTGITF